MLPTQADVMVGEGGGTEVETIEEYKPLSDIEYLQVGIPADPCDRVAHSRGCVTLLSGFGDACASSCCGTFATSQYNVVLSVSVSLSHTHSHLCVNSLSVCMCVCMFLVVYIPTGTLSHTGQWTKGGRDIRNEKLRHPAPAAYRSAGIRDWDYGTRENTVCDACSHIIRHTLHI